NTQGAVTFKGSKIVTFAWAVLTETQDFELDLSIDTPELVQSYYDIAGIERIDGRIVVLAELVPAVAGHSATLEPASGDGPFYYKTGAGELDLDATETSDTIAMAVFVNVDPALAPFNAMLAQGGVACDDTVTAGSFSESFVPDGADILYFQRACP
ncbi:MAG: hypothetical protein KC420_01255, partial [Myxococcales bacterium]|nr:hypothetical protein [Myxococcales bacterium]